MTCVVWYTVKCAEFTWQTSVKFYENANNIFKNSVKDIKTHVLHMFTICSTYVWMNTCLTIFENKYIFNICQIHLLNICQIHMLNILWKTHMVNICLAYVNRKIC